jgi:hypothetical protein
MRARVLASLWPRPQGCELFTFPPRFLRQQQVYPIPLPLEVIVLCTVNGLKMLKSTHKPAAITPLPLGWTEHKAPTGHTYYYNAETKESTYSRPVLKALPPAPAPLDPSQSFLQYQSAGRVPDFNNTVGRGGFHSNDGGRGGHAGPRDSRPKPQPNDKPISKHSIPGHDNWMLVHTKYGRRFVYNVEKDQSYWRIPEKLKEGILELDQQRIKEKADAAAKEKQKAEEIVQPQQDAPQNGHEGDEDSSEYEEVEVTDDEDEENPAKRQRTEDPVPDQPVEFNEDDIAYQLAAMGQEYGLDQGEYDDGEMEEWEEGAEGMGISEEDSIALFKDLLNDSGINPYSPWDKLVEEGRLVDDIRYTALSTMKARKEVWEEWSKEKIKVLRELRAKVEKKDPMIPYLAFLQKHANPKLYWPEFKRKYRKEDEMRDPKLSDKEREKLYREHINRLRLPQSTLKSDLSKLLKDQPLSKLNNSTPPTNLPAEILSQIAFISLEPSIRDPLVEAYISTLPPPPESQDAAESEDAIKERVEKDRRQKALEEREKRVAEDKKRQQKSLAFGKGRLREEEAEIARAMNVSKKGLRDHLMEGTAESAS